MFFILPLILHVISILLDYCLVNLFGFHVVYVLVYSLLLSNLFTRIKFMIGMAMTVVDSGNNSSASLW